MDFWFEMQPHFHKHFVEEGGGFLTESAGDFENENASVDELP
jgi:hypothetical protein